MEYFLPDSELEQILDDLTAVEESHELPPPTGFHWQIPRDTIIKTVQINTAEGKVITLNRKETLEYYKILTWCQYYGRNYFRPDLYQTQKDIIAFFVKFKWIVNEVFRGAGKTWIAEFILSYKICENPNLRLFIVSEEQSKTIDRVMFVRNIITSPLVIRDYGYLIKQSNKRHKSQDRAASFTCIRTREFIEPTLKAMSWQDQKMQGFHFDGGIFDDVWSIQLQNTIGAKEKFLKWYNSFKFTLEQCEWFIMLRTRKAVNDLYAELDKLHEHTKFITPLVLKFPPKESYSIEIDSISSKYYVKILDEEKFADHLIYDSCLMEHDDKIVPKYTIEDCIISDFKDHESFYREMQNKPFIPEGNLFKWENIILYSYERRGDNPLVNLFYEQLHTINFIMITDPARGTTSDYDALGVMAYYEGKFWLHEARIGKWNPAQRESVIRELHELYPNAPLYVESDFGQLSMFDDIKRKIPGLVIRGFESKGKGQKKQMLYEGDKKAAKKGKIHDSLAFPISNRQLYICEKIPLLSDPNGLKDQIIGFPNITTFDFIDMLAMGVLILKKKQKKEPLIFAF